MKRLITLILLCLLLGAVLNVTIAWRLAMFPVTRHAFEFDRQLTPAEAHEHWAVLSDRTVPASIIPFGAVQSRFGVSEVILQAHDGDIFMARAIVRFGWPLRSMQFESSFAAPEDGSFIEESYSHVVTIPPFAKLLGKRMPPYLPTRVRPLSFAFDSIFWGGTVLTAALLGKIWRRRCRVDANHCGECDYQMAGEDHAGRRCPECGTVAGTSPHRLRQPLRWWMAPLILPIIAFLAYWFAGQTWWGEIRFWAGASLENILLDHLPGLLLLLFVVTAMAWSTYRDRTVPQRIGLTWAAALLLVVPSWCAAHLLVLVISA